MRPLPAVARRLLVLEAAIAFNVSVHPERFFGVNAAWLHMGTLCDTLIVGTAILDQPVTVRQLQAVFADRLLRFARFCQRPRESRLAMGLPVWELDPHFDLGAHVVHVTLPAPGDWAALLWLVGHLMAVPLDPRRPLWKMHVVERFGAGSALIMRQSHAVADGAALMHVLDTLTGQTAEASRASLPPEPETPRDGAQPGLADAIARPWTVSTELAPFPAICSTVVWPPPVTRSARPCAASAVPRPWANSSSCHPTTRPSCVAAAGRPSGRSRLILSPSARSSPSAARQSRLKQRLRQ
ncbi:MAG: hypothetical protein IT318_24375 [Anaerolineales bacterium]|nr:hypothetical protein [Anaerolineales bacterium]